MDELQPVLHRVRYGERPGQDLLLAFWLRLMIDRRSGASRRVRQGIEELFLTAAAKAALEEVGEGPLLAQCQDAARRYVEVSLADPRYRSTMLGFSHLNEARVHAKVADDVLTMLDALASVKLTGPASGLPCALIAGVVEALPDAATVLREASRKHLGSAGLLAQLL